MFELSDDLTLIERNHYTYLDVAADAGGLYTIVATLCSAILSVINYNNFNKYLIDKIDSLNTESSQKMSEQISRGCCSNIIEFVIDNLPSCCICCK